MRFSFPTSPFKHPLQQWFNHPWGNRPLFPENWFPLTRLLGCWIKQLTFSILETVGQAVLVLKEAFHFARRGQLSFRHTMEQTAFIGIDSLGIALLLTLFTGMVLALQLAQELTRQGAGTMVGALVSLSILRELAPIMTGFAVIAMVGSAYCAEIATMNIQHQIDALKVMSVDPIRYIVLPRLLAGIVALPMMTLLTGLAGIIGGMMISYYIGELNPTTFLESVWSNTKPTDLSGALIKSSVFGALIVTLSCTIGLNTKGGAKDVGDATTRAVVWTFIAMALADYALSFILFGGD